jgi:hypothetical protein
MLNRGFQGLLALSILAMLCFPSAGGARQEGAALKKSTAPDNAKPTVVDPHDLNGVWMMHPGGIEKMVPESLHPPMTPWAQARFDAVIPTMGPRDQLGKEDDPLLKCEPYGVPKILLIPQPFEIVQTPKRMFQFFEMFHIWRTIWTDGRPLPKDADPTWMGTAVGKWEGDTFVVDTVGFNDKTWVEFFGYPHSEEMHVTERYKRVDAKTMSIAVTIEDPKAYTKPWVNPPFEFTLEPTWEIQEHFCIIDEESAYGDKIRLPAGGEEPVTPVTPAEKK